MSFLWHGLTEQGAQVPVQVDAQGRVIAVDGTPGVSNWERTGTTLSPATLGDDVVLKDGAGTTTVQLNNDGTATFAGDVKIGGTLPANPNITLNADGSVRFAQNNVSVAADGTSAFKKLATFYNGGFTSGSVDLTNKLDTILLRGAGDSANASSTMFRVGRYEALGNNARSTFGIYLRHNIESEGSYPLAAEFRSDGSATFTGNITAANVTFRSADPQFYVKTKNTDGLPQYVGPELDLLAEVARLEALVRHLYETLRLAPPAGWPVWDGNDDVLRQLRK